MKSDPYFTTSYYVQKILMLKISRINVWIFWVFAKLDVRWRSEVEKWMQSDLELTLWTSHRKLSQNPQVPLVSLATLVSIITLVPLTSLVSLIILVPLVRNYGAIRWKKRNIIPHNFRFKIYSSIFVLDRYSVVGAVKLMYQNLMVFFSYPEHFIIKFVLTNISLISTNMVRLISHPWTQY